MADAVLPAQVQVRLLAQRLRVRTAWLLGELVGDGVPVAQVSPRRWMVAADDFRAWWAARQERARQERARQERARQGAKRQGATA